MRYNTGYKLVVTVFGRHVFGQVSGGDESFMVRVCVCVCVIQVKLVFMR